MARAAELGGAGGIRANSPQDIRAVKQLVRLPVIGIFKKSYPDSEVYITPTIDEALAVAQTGAEVIALDATARPRPKRQKLAEIIRTLREKTDALLMADISNFEEGVEAERMGFDIVATTLSGYIEEPVAEISEPDLELVRELAKALKIPIIAEGRINTPQQAVAAIHCGAWAVVVGTAITRPHIITQRFVQALRQSLSR